MIDRARLERLHADLADRLDFLNSSGAYANLANGVTTTGVDDIDLWIGGLAEKQMPFGGLLGSTFNFVFETQMEALQNGDRFYYLARTRRPELPHRAREQLVRQADHAQHRRDAPAGRRVLDADLHSRGRSRPSSSTKASAAPIRLGDNPLHRSGRPRQSADTPAVDTNYLHYTGDDHVVLGGTEGNDTMIASIGDDTLWGDGGNDRLEGGDGNDQILGGDGDDIMTDLGGDDLIQGGDGNDVINGGNGINLILGGFGNDFIIAGEDPSEIFGGDGDDFILRQPDHRGRDRQRRRRLDRDRHRRTARPATTSTRSRAT